MAPMGEVAGWRRLWAHADLRNLLLLLAAWVILLLLIPPQHEYPIIDDWIYAGAVKNLLATGLFVTPPEAQANLVGLAFWGALWSKLLGFSFTTLTYSTLALVPLGLAAFYGLARAVTVPPAGALWATALLGFNPLFVHLSYSYMTDVPFVALMLAACYCYVRGLQGAGLGWFGAAGLFAGGSHLVRQFGVLVPLAFLAYLALDGLLTRRLRWRELLLTALVPGVIIGGWWLWARNIPPTPANLVSASRAAAFVLQATWPHVILLRLGATLPLLGFFAWGALRLRPARWWLIGLAGAALVWTVYGADYPMGQWNPMTEPPFTMQAGPLAVPLPQEPFSFGRVGNIIRIDGIDFFQYTQAPIWSPEAWRGLWVLGVLLGVLLLAKLADGLLDWLRERWRRPRLDPVAGVYLLGLGLGGVSIALAGDFYDRYLLAFLPGVILYVARGAAGWGRLAWGYASVALAALVLFTVLLKADQVDHDNARWQAGHWLLARAGPPQVGYDWDNWVAGGNPAWHVSDLHFDGFRTEQRFPYLSRLSGFTTRYVLAEAAANAPPIPAIPPAP